MPYTMPKLTAFARLLIIGVTSCGGISKTSDAVTVWISVLSLNAFIMFWSPEIWART